MTSSRTSTNSSVINIFLKYADTASTITKIESCFHRIFDIDESRLPDEWYWNPVSKVRKQPFEYKPDTTWNTQKPFTGLRYKVGASKK